MATLSAFSTLSSIARANSNLSSSSSSISCNLPLQFVRLHSHVNISSSKISRVSVVNKFPRRLKTKIRSSVAEEQQTLIPTEDGTEEAQTSSVTEQPVSVPVSPSDVLTMLFQAEGTMTETAVPTVTKALEETEGISNFKVQVVEGIASVELTKQTTVQATGVASSLVEIIQGSGFKLQTLNLSFEDEEDIN